jgi:hypothetical protein
MEKSTLFIQSGEDFMGAPSISEKREETASLKEIYMKTLLVSMISLVFLASCGPISVNRSFLEEMDRKDESFFQAGKTFDTIPGDTGNASYTRSEMLKRTPFNEDDRPAWSESGKIKKDLRYKLSKLNEKERIWFQRNESLFANDSQKIYFLDLSSEEKQQYMASLTGESYSEPTKYRQPASYFGYKARGSRNVELGMHKNAVVEVWGNPHRVDVAGDPRYENERWTFYEQGRKRYVYFAQGKVEGWVTE